jgi:4'-phosphopantetheinyl transferase
MTDGIVHVWLIRLDLPDALMARCAAVLDGAERDRAAALTHPANRDRFVAAHGAVRLILGGHLGVPPGRIAWQHGPNGKPELAGAGADGGQVSISHSGRLAALALTGGRSVGIDLQQFPATLDPRRMAERFYPPDEARFVAAGRAGGQLSRFITLWARKEACVKVGGGVLMQGLRLRVTGRGSVVVTDPGGPLPGPYLVQDVPAAPRFGAAVAAGGAAGYRVARHWWPARAARSQAVLPASEQLGLLIVRRGFPAEDEHDRTGPDQPHRGRDDHRPDGVHLDERADQVQRVDAEEHRRDEPRPVPPAAVRPGHPQPQADRDQPGEHVGGDEADLGGVHLRRAVVRVLRQDR